MVDFYTSMIKSLNFTASHPRQQSSALLAKLGNISLYATHYAIQSHYAYITLLVETVFGINKSTVRGMIKARPVPDNIKHSSIQTSKHFPVATDKLSC